MMYQNEYVAEFVIYTHLKEKREKFMKLIFKVIFIFVQR